MSKGVWAAKKLACQEFKLKKKITLNKAASPGQRHVIPFAVKWTLNIASLHKIEKSHKIFRHWSLPPVALPLEKNFNIRRKLHPVADDTHVDELWSFGKTLTLAKNLDICFPTFDKNMKSRLECEQESILTCPFRNAVQTENIMPLQTLKLKKRGLPKFF